MASIGSSAASAQSYARVAGLLLLLSMIGGGLGEFYIPNEMIVSGDAAATAHNIVTSSALYRFGFAAYLVEAICDITLALVFYVLLRPVNKYVALLAAFFGLVSTAVFAGGELFYYAPTHILGGASYLNTFSNEQLNTLSQLSLKLYGLCAGIFMAFYGIATSIRGYLIYRSEYLPKWLGALVVIAGIGFILKNFMLVLAPEFPSDLFLLPMPVVVLSMMVWFLVKGVDVSKWEAKAAA
jgi:hypothetical protein